jgi:hypothetical protein
MPKGSDLVIQVHYHPKGKPASDQSKVGFHFAKAPTGRSVDHHSRSRRTSAFCKASTLPAGEKEHIQKASFIVPTDCETFAVGAHAHYLGKRMEMTANFPDGSTRWLLKMSDWDFAWQEDYSFKQPIKLPARHASRRAHFLRQFRGESRISPRIRRSGSAGGQRQPMKWVSSRSR